LEKASPKAKVYADFCMQCHLASGREILKLPPLDGSDWLIKKETQSIHAVKIWTDGYDSSQRKKI
jgi:hypothetical protein